ncbi:Rrp15p-domain-containing protein [Corynascus novoguineensis]|uniref:Rrp15p-domain-containing protein n=1 Tax=Corynascus novoguineensis TaxID=1126955 RepID=A0AAN7CUE6_9PEZI|nr:Rrp15p-domain-containing protein [Corynascus novoguineensis]
MAGTSIKKRSYSDGTRGRAARPTKKQRKIAAYHSSSEDSASDDEGAPVPANLLDSDDEDLDNVEVDDGASSTGFGSDSGSDSLSEAEPAPKRKPQSKKEKPFIAKDAPASSDASAGEEDHSSDGDEDDDDDDDLSDAASHSDASTARQRGSKDTRSKRNDPAAFATSISKMLSSKLPASRRADPIVARSVSAAEQARQAVDSALAAKARRRLREQKRLAMEKGRVRDVLVASATTRTLNVATGEIEEVPDDENTEGPRTTAEILAAERRLRKVAQRGVVKLFNAVRAAQVKAAEAERAARREGVIGIKRKEEKVAEMSRKGFLDLIASGGGGLKKGGLEEA